MKAQTRLTPKSVNPVGRPSSGTGIVTEIRRYHEYNQRAMADLLYVTREQVVRIESGARDLEKAGREVRYVLMNMGRRIPGRQRSAALNAWLSTTEDYFQEKPLGGKFS